jgi:6-phosphogluconolactonase
LLDACGPPCHIALAGGGTPRRFYRALATAGAARDWHQIHFWFGDERAVPADHPDSNYRMARETLFDHLPVPAGNIHPMPVPDVVSAATLAEAAREYETALRQLPQEDGRPRFDLVLLGMGADGHTASLFPGTDAVGESRRMVMAVWVPQLSAWRLTLTLPVLNAARHVWVMVTGKAKATVLRQVLARREPLLPIQRLQPQAGIDWFVDAAAMGGACP